MSMRSTNQDLKSLNTHHTGVTHTSKTGHVINKEKTGRNLIVFKLKHLVKTRTCGPKPTFTEQ